MKTIILKLDRISPQEKKQTDVKTQESETHLFTYLGIPKKN